MNAAGSVYPRRLKVAVAGVLVIGLLAALLSAGAGADSAEGGVVVRQPSQPKSGPGGSNYTHHFRVHAGGSGSDAWYVFEPTKPRPRKAPLTIVMHGYGEFSGYASMLGLIRHTVRKGNIAIYPRWQTGIATPCPGPYLIQPCIDSAANGIKDALAYLRARPDRRVQPLVGRASYFGFSFGGIVTANMTNRYRQLSLPKPRAMFLDDPHDGALAGLGEPALDDSLAGIPSTVKLQCHSPTEGVFAEPSQGGLAGSCNAVFPMLGHIPNRNKDLVLTHTDDHGTPTLAAIHGVCARGAIQAAAAEPNAYDWNFCWKVWDALRSCALRGKYCRYALGNTREHRSHGRWSDGVPVKPLKIRDGAPIRP